MQLKLRLRYCLFASTVFLSILLSGFLTRAEAAKNTNTGSTAPESTAENKDIVAMINGTAITRKQFDNAMDYQVEIAAIKGVTLSNAQLSDLKYQMLESLIGEELLYQESRKSGIKITEKEIDEAFEERKQKAQFETDAEFEAELKKTNKTMATYRAEIEHGLAIDRFIKEKFTDTTVIPDSDAKQYYDSNLGYFQVPAKVRLSHIMARVAADADQSEKDKATLKLEQAIKRLEAGEDFAVVAKEVSEDDKSKDNGGDIGYLSKGMVQKSFEEAAFSLKKDEISGVVQTIAGYHVLKVTEKSDASTIAFEEAKDDIVNNLKSSKVNNLVGSYIKDLKNRSTIVTYPIIR